MSNEDVYFANEEYKQVQVLMYETERLTREEYELVNAWFPEFASNQLFHYHYGDFFLNLNVYSEVEKEAYDLQREMGY